MKLARELSMWQEPGQVKVPVQCYRCVISSALCYCTSLGYSSSARLPSVKPVISEPAKESNAKFGGKVPFHHISRPFYTIHEIEIRPPSVCGIDYLWTYCMAVKFWLLLPLDHTPRDFEIWKKKRFWGILYQYFSFLLTWDSMGAKMSNCYSSYKWQRKVFKLFLNFLWNGPHKNYVGDLWGNETPQLSGKQAIVQRNGLTLILWLAGTDSTYVVFLWPCNVQGHFRSFVAFVMFHIKQGLMIRDRRKHFCIAIRAKQWEIYRHM